MKNLKMRLVLVVVLFCAIIAGAEPVGTEFTYQGRLIDANSLADGEYDFIFRIYDAESTGTQAGQDVNIPDVDVIDGYFTVELDFGTDVFNGNSVWLEIGVRPGQMNDPNVYTTLKPRHKITPVPYSLHTRGVFVDSYNDNHDSNNNTFVGLDAGRSNPTGHNNTFIGGLAGERTSTGYYNTFVGFNAGRYNTTGRENTFIGGLAGEKTSTGYANTFVGLNAGRYNTTGYRNAFFGIGAGFVNTTGYYNTFIGNYAGTHNDIGHANTYVGYFAGPFNNYGSGNVFIGYMAGYSQTGSNKLIIANGPDDANTLIYGEFDSREVGIGTTSPGYELHVVGDIAYTGGIYDISDVRLKENITPLTNAIEKISALRGIYFNNKADPSEKREVGIIAQDVEAVLPELVSTTADGYKSIDYTKLTAVLVEAVKELKAENYSLKQKVEALEKTIVRERFVSDKEF